ncbi:MarR family winged helix-turn-helix transcriptional regulator [Rhizomonospora bruguierae]|uniref:MarR family winged helix-turn-helix transcriptional regulator n=1 Tax=Rhizomonospora bruguierae TaxID=1581705 RepID=UPI001BCF7E73|nr:MarR family transcriptional regulator [Micromonospora sp. NBRC 107566]
MAENRGPDGPGLSVAAAVEFAADPLVSLWDASRERAATRLSGSQLRALLVVEDHEGINLRGLATALGMILSSASRLCDRLVAAGMLEREPGRLDRREISLSLTMVGHRLLEDLRQDRRRRLEATLARMSQADRVALLRGLRAFAAAEPADGEPAIVGSRIRTA